MQELSIIKTVFLSIILEAFPFILLGIVISSIVQVLVPNDVFKKWLPKNMYVALIPATFLGFLLPVCECAIIPLVRGLIKKGLPLHLGIVMMISAPVINPIVILSTYFAFGDKPYMVLLRVGIIVLLSLMIGLISSKLFKKNQLRDIKGESNETIVSEGKESAFRKVKHVLYHVNDETISTGKYIIFGAFITAIIQTYMSRDVFASLSQSEAAAPLFAMTFAYILSICSSSDAFIAASFKGIFSTSASLAFLTYGPVFDFKNTIIMLSYFKVRFVLTMFVLVSVLVYVMCLSVGFLM
ncbi:permease (plasmid) [Pontibacillus sp. ALD_SL1]|uniref:permease n=1 Tax=Pontibacillus sp. ALD_SL1 TaxID=2777185 RepID=UPI001A9615FB|nr:permease [Pontibacillus sp. ALD_SL1]QST02165.1 permease [Pontibacillus sp. ALD_SL1]